MNRFSEDPRFAGIRPFEKIMLMMVMVMVMMMVMVMVV